MSQENVEIVREGIRRYNARDWEGLKRLYDPGAVLHHLEEWPEPGPTVGRDAVVEEWKTVVEAWGGRGDLIEEDSWAKGEWVVLHCRLATTGGASGLGIDSPFTGVYRLRNGLVVDHRSLWGHVDPLEAVGLPE
jgi:SnoaL-like protein